MNNSMAKSVLWVILIGLLVGCSSVSQKNHSSLKNDSWYNDVTSTSTLVNIAPKYRGISIGDPIAEVINLENDPPYNSIIPSLPDDCNQSPEHTIYDTSGNWVVHIFAKDGKVNRILTGRMSRKPEPKGCQALAEDVLLKNTEQYGGAIIREDQSIEEALNP